MDRTLVGWIELLNVNPLTNSVNVLNTLTLTNTPTGKITPLTFGPVTLTLNNNWANVQTLTLRPPRPPRPALPLARDATSVECCDTNG